MSGPLLLPFGLPDFLHSLQTRVRPICIVEHLFYNGSPGQGSTSSDGFSDPWL